MSCDQARSQRRKAEEAQRRQWEEERKRAETREKRQQDENRWRRFVELAGRWEEAELASRFLEVLEQSPGDSEKTYGGRTTAQWLAWAREKRDAFDPTRWAPADIWSNLASVTSWEYRG
jgi:urease accessory protein UreF